MYPQKGPSRSFFFYAIEHNEEVKEKPGMCYQPRDLYFPTTSKCYHVHRDRANVSKYSEAPDSCYSGHNLKILKPTSSDELFFIRNSILSNIAKENATKIPGIWIDPQIKKDKQSMSTKFYLYYENCDVAINIK